MNIDDVRKAVDDAKQGDLSAAVMDVILDFAHAVLTPTETVRQAIRERYQHPHEALDNHCNAIIADWITGILTPAAKETTK